MPAPASSVSGTTRVKRPTQVDGCNECTELREQVARLLDLIVAAGVEPPELEHLSGGAIPGGLSVRQVEVGVLIARGYSNAQVADALYLGVNSVKTHARGLYRTLGVHNRTEAALWFVRMGLAEPTTGDRRVTRSRRSDEGLRPQSWSCAADGARR